MSEILEVQIPGATRDVIDRLKTTFGVRTDAEVLSRALGLANTAMKIAGIDKKVTLSGKDADKAITVDLDQ